MDSDLTNEECKSNKRRLLKHALGSYERRDFEEAANTFSQLINCFESKDPEWFIKRCDCYQHLGLDNEAMQDAKMVVKLDPESYKGYSLLGVLHQIHGRYDEALFCHFDCLEILWLSGTNIKLPAVAEKCLEDIMRSARPVAELPDNIQEQSILTQLYILGNSLRREVQHTLTIRSMEVALIICDRSDEVDESLKMKIYFVLGQSQQGTEKYEESVESFKQSLSLALRVGNISYETKNYLNLSSLSLEQERHAEAAAYYIRLLAVGQDVLSAVGDDQSKYREHWSMEMEASILLNLCIAFKTMRLYDEALEYAKRYDKVINTLNVSPSPSPDVPAIRIGEDHRPKSVPTLGFTDSLFLQRSVDLSGVLQSKFILGDLYELRGDLDEAMTNYLEWMNMSESMSREAGGFENTYLLDTASALSCQGSILMKKGNFEMALECFRKQTVLAKKSKIPQLIMESALSRGDALVGLHRLNEARTAYDFARKVGRSLDDLEPECMCMWKVASVFAAENRFTHAAYYCEQAVALASKCEKRSVQMKLSYELALYYQHSTSEKELRKASEILFEMIKFQESHIFTHQRNGGKHFHEEEKMLGRCYIAMQVVLHKLGELKLSAAFGESWRVRTFNQLRNEAPEIPQISSFTKGDDNGATKCGLVKEQVEDDIVKISQSTKLDDFLQSDGDSVALTYNLCDEGFLVQVIQPHLGVTKSYLSSKLDIKPYETGPKIIRLINQLGKITSKDKEATHLCNIYNCESRCLPTNEPVQAIPLPEYKKEALKYPGAGDHKEKENAKEQCIPRLGSGEGQSKDPKKELPVLEELHNILILPVEDFLVDLKPGCNVTVVPDAALKKIPFDALTNPSTRTQLGDRFHVTITPCISFLKATNGRPRTMESPIVPDARDQKAATPSPRPSTSKKNSTKNCSVRSSLKSRPKSSSKHSARSSPRLAASISLDEEIKAFRKTELLKSYSKIEDIDALNLSGFSSSISRLVTCTATGTNVLTSPRYIPPYRQVTMKLKCSVVGSPALPSALKYQGQLWRPNSKLPSAVKECKKVAEYFDVTPVIGMEASKKAVLDELQNSTVIHISTFADLHKGLIAFSPNEFPSHESVPDEESYLISPDELCSTSLHKIQLLVLSSGHGWPDSPDSKHTKQMRNEKNPLFLPELFLSAVSSVVTTLWNVPDLVKERFFFYFYDSLQCGNKISQALKDAKSAVREKYADPLYWSGFIAVGSDVTVDLSAIRRSQLHSSLDFAGGEELNLKPAVDEVITPDRAMNQLQNHFSRLAGYLPLKSLNRDVVGALIELLEESMDRLTADSNADRPIILLPDLIGEAKGAIGLLGDLGFDFQPADVPTPPSNTIDPLPIIPGLEVTAVVFPHWNKDALLLPAHQALTGLQDICSSDVALQYLARILPLSQTILCALIDLLAVTRHTPEVQLRAQDDGVRLLWNDRFIRRYLTEIGFMQINDLILFYKTSRNRTLLIASLQFFASLCLHRDQSVLERLNVASLGQPPKETVPNEKRELITIKPVIMPRKEIILVSSWMQDQHPGKDEERGIKHLAQRLQSAKDQYRRTLEHAKWWHKNLLAPQAQIKLSEIGMEKGNKPLKRKVKSGATPSCQRESVTGTPDPHDREPFFRSFAAAMKKRDYANYLVKKRCDELESRYQAKIHEIYREYAVNG